MKRLVFAAPAILFGCSLTVDVDRFNSGAVLTDATTTPDAVAETTPDADAPPSDAVAETADTATRPAQIFIAGGNVGDVDGMTVNETSVLRGELSATGEIAAWAAAGNLSASATSTQATRSGRNVFILGPDFQTTDALTARYARFDDRGVLSDWFGNKALPARGRVAAASTDKFVYAIGGTLGTGETADIFVAPIESDGSSGVFAAARPLREQRAGACAVALDNNLYVIGGYGPGSPGFATAIRAPIAADGSLGAWTSQGTLSFGLSGCSAVAVGKRIYVFGGYGALNKVQHALVGATGDVGTWSTAGNMPSEHAYFQAVVAGGFVVAAGGFGAGSSRRAAAEVAAISESAVGAWKPTRPLPKARVFVNAFGFD